MLFLSVLVVFALVEASKRAFAFADRENSAKRIKYQLSGEFRTEYLAGDRKAVRELFDSGDETIVNEALFPFLAEQGDVKLFKDMLANPNLFINSTHGLNAFKNAVDGDKPSIARLILEDGRLDVSALAERFLMQYTLFPSPSVQIIKLLLYYFSPPMNRLIELVSTNRIPEPSETDKALMTESIVSSLADSQAYPEAFTTDRYWQQLRGILTENNARAVELLSLVELCRKNSVEALYAQFTELSLFQQDFFLEASMRGKHDNVIRHLQRLAFDSTSQKTVEELKSWAVELMEHGYHHVALCNKARVWAILRLLTFRTYFAGIGLPGELQLDLLSRIYYEFLQ